MGRMSEMTDAEVAGMQRAVARIRELELQLAACEYRLNESKTEEDHMSTPEVSDLGEQFETPDEALIDAEKTIKKLKDEQNRLRLRVSEAELQKDRVMGQVSDAELRLKKFKDAVITIVLELADDHV
jgi:chromosome segregation ATPase